MLNKINYHNNLVNEDLSHVRPFKHDLDFYVFLQSSHQFLQPYYVYQVTWTYLTQSTACLLF